MKGGGITGKANIKMEEKISFKLDFGNYRKMGQRLRRQKDALNETLLTNSVSVGAQMFSITLAPEIDVP